MWNSIRSLIQYYKNKPNNEILVLLLKYIENEKKIQNLDTLSGLGEPKINLNFTPFNKPWGRPQNDGPALRGINMIIIKNILNKEFPSICYKVILEIINKDLKYTIDNYDKPCYDLWEENFGWHFYTRSVQLKFIKLSINFFGKNLLNIELDKLKLVYEDLKIKLTHHLDNSIISSFDENGNVRKKNDASILLALCHTNFDATILELINIERFLKVGDDLISFFSYKYNNNNNNLIGRYDNDCYYDGHIWIICSLALAQVYLYTKNKCLRNKAETIIDYILQIDENLNLSEQYDIDNNLQLSAKNLTWNYAELLLTSNLINNIDL